MDSKDDGFLACRAAFFDNWFIPRTRIVNTSRLCDTVRPGIHCRYFLSKRRSRATDLQTSEAEVGFTLTTGIR